MDGNRKDDIEFDSPEDYKALFWVNDDIDKISGDEEDDDDSGTPNCDDGKINSLRDLEDFTRLHIQVDDYLATLAGVKYYLKFEDISSGAPSINIFEAYHPSLLYLSNAKFANEQIKKELLLTVASTKQEIDKKYILPGDTISPFILEGKSAGLGSLTLIIKKDGFEMFRKFVELDLRPIEEFYERFAVNSTGIDDFVNSISNSEGTYTYQPESDDYILYIHGWNMPEWEKNRWAETMFKRLWWQGYKGHCGLFSWPTLTTISPVITPWNYDHSEMRSWNSAEALLDRLEKLNTSHPGKVRVLAHSMGNVVSTEALRVSSSQVLHTFISSQAAISAHVYDNSLNEYWHSSADQIVGGYTTPNIYGHYFSGEASTDPYAKDASKGAGKMIRMYNVKDYALKWWKENNRNKPNWFYNYSGDIDSYDASSGDRFYHDPLFPIGERDLELIVATINDDRFEIFAFAAESRSLALGAERTENVSGFNRNIDLKEIGFKKNHYSHSKQFRSNIVDELKYWKLVIDKSKLEAYK